MKKPELLSNIDWLLRDKYPDFLTNPKKYLPVIKKDVDKLQKGEPLAYVVGWVDFLGVRIDLSRRPLIPRVETEFWVEKELKNLALHKSSFKALDLCAGSGCIGLAILKYLPKSQVIFSDKDPDCLRQIRKNVGLNKIKPGRARIVNSDIFRNIKGYFDYIFTNPPYIPSGRKLPRPVSEYEPKQALFGGKDGSIFLDKILRAAPEYLRPGGEIYFEFDSGQKHKLNKMLAKLPYKSFELRKDHYGKWRYGVAKMP